MSKPLSTSRIVVMTFARQSDAEAACERIGSQGCYCLPIKEDEEEDATTYTLGFVNHSSSLTMAQQRVLEEFGATDIEMYPLNARLDYQNYSHTLYYNGYEALDADLGYLIEQEIEKQVMVFDENEQSAYTWRIVFCTEEEIGQEQQDRISAAITPIAWHWNEPVTGEVSPTSIFK